MISVPFTKYTSCGNNFVILDETRGAVTSEMSLSKIAYYAADGCFGVGADNFLVVQRSNADTLEAIRSTRGYWPAPPDASSAEYLFRMFEPDGMEALACGNGLLSVAQYLHEHRGVDATTIMTRVPMREPVVVTLGVAESTGRTWVNLGRPSRVPDTMVDTSTLSRVSPDVDLVEDIKVDFRQHDLTPFFEGASLAFTGYLTFTGEPHLVVFLDGLLAEIMFGRRNGQGECQDIEKRKQFGTWLLGRVGDFLNKHSGLFPQGMSLNVARVRNSSVIDYRTYERGIWRETLACGTGALGVANVARTLGLVDAERLTLIPHRCTWHDRNAELRLQHGAGGEWVLEGQPRAICEGVFIADVDTRECATPVPSTESEANDEMLSASSA